MSITYTYEIIKVDAQSRIMEIVYSSEGRQTMHIGARLPYKGETTEAVVQMFAPIAHWTEQAAEVVVPEFDAGSVTVPDLGSVVPSYKEQRETAYRKEADPLFFKAQRGEATVQEWQDKVAEIKARYPEDGTGPIAPLIPVTEV